MSVPGCGLRPTLPVIADVGTSLIPVPARTAKLPAVARFTVVGVAAALLPASTRIAPSAAKTDRLATATTARERFVMKRVMRILLSDLQRRPDFASVGLLRPVC